MLSYGCRHVSKNQLWQDWRTRLSKIIWRGVECGRQLDLKRQKMTVCGWCGDIFRKCWKEMYFSTSLKSIHLINIILQRSRVQESSSSSGSLESDDDEDDDDDFEDDDDDDEDDRSHLIAPSGCTTT